MGWVDSSVREVRFLRVQPTEFRGEGVTGEWKARGSETVYSLRKQRLQRKCRRLHVDPQEESPVCEDGPPCLKRYMGSGPPTF